MFWIHVDKIHFVTIKWTTNLNHSLCSPAMMHLVNIIINKTKIPKHRHTQLHTVAHLSLAVIKWVIHSESNLVEFYYYLCTNLKWLWSYERCETRAVSRVPVKKTHMIDCYLDDFVFYIRFHIWRIPVRLEVVSCSAHMPEPHTMFSFHSIGYCLRQRQTRCVLNTNQVNAASSVVYGISNCTNVVSPNHFSFSNAL